MVAPLGDLGHPAHGVDPVEKRVEMHRPAQRPVEAVPALE